MEENEYCLAWLKVFSILPIDRISHIVIADSNEKTYANELVPVKHILTKVINVFFDQANANYFFFYQTILKHRITQGNSIASSIRFLYRFSADFK